MLSMTFFMDSTRRTSVIDRMVQSNFNTRRTSAQVLHDGCEKPLVFDVPHALICPAGDIGNQLSEAPLGVASLEFRQGVE
jgi:hypothetical protein